MQIIDTIFLYITKTIAYLSIIALVLVIIDFARMWINEDCKSFTKLF